MKLKYNLCKLVILISLLYSQAFASTTNVSATVTSADGQVYNSGTFVATFVPDPNRPTEVYTVGGVPFTKGFTGSFNSAGLFTVTVTDNLTIGPANSKWDFTVCSKTTAPCVTYRTSVSGGALDLTAQISAIAPAISINANGAPGYVGAAYVDAEVLKPSFGTHYYNTVSNTLRAYNGVSWISIGNGSIGINIKTDCVGVVGDGVTNDGPALTTCSQLYAYRTLYAPKTNASSSGCDYYLGTTWTIYSHILGESAAWDASGLAQGQGVNFCAAQGIGRALNLQLVNCRGSCSFQNFNVVYQGNFFGNIQAPTKFVLPAGSFLDDYDRTIVTASRLAGNLTVQISGINGVGEKLYQLVGSQVLISGSDPSINGVCEISALSGLSSFGDNPSTFTCAQAGADVGPFVTGKISLPTTGLYFDVGVGICGNFYKFNNVNVIGFHIGVNGDAQSSSCLNPFADDLKWEDSSLVNNQVHAFFTRGTDSSVDYFENINFYYNGGMSVNDGSALGNTYNANNWSNNGSQWAGPATPTTKNVSTYNRVSSIIAVVMSQANTDIQQGSCAVIAGAVDGTFNTPATKCWFVTSVTDSTHFSVRQPGNPGDAATTGGTLRDGKFSEKYLSSGIDSGSFRIGIDSSGSYDTTLTHNYMEGGQNCKAGAGTLVISGTNFPICATGSFQGGYIGTQIFQASALGSNLTHLGNKNDGTGGYLLQFHAGSTVSKNEYLQWDTFDNNGAWRLDVLPTGALGANGYWHLTSDLTNQTRIALFGSNNTGNSYFNGTGIGEVSIQRGYSGTAGSGGACVYDGSTSVTYGCIKSTGTTGLNFTSKGTNPATSGLVRLIKTDQICFRNNANSADVCFSLTGTDQISVGGASGVKFNGAAESSGGFLSTGASPGNVSAAGFGYSTGLGQAVVTQNGGTQNPINPELFASCSGVASPSTTIGLFPFGENSALTCTVAVTVNGEPSLESSRMISTIRAISSAAGVNASSGVVTVRKNGAGTALTCTFGTTTACLDTTGNNKVSFAAGDTIGIQVTTQAAETLANIRVTIQ